MGDSMPISAWIVANPKIKYLARKYQISEYLLTSLKIKDDKQAEKIAIANKITIDREYYEAYASASDTLTFFGKPEAVRYEDKVFDSGEEIVRITMRFKTATILWDMPKDEYKKVSPKQWIEKFRNYVLVKADKKVYISDKGGRRTKLVWWQAKKVRFVNVTSDKTTFKKLVEIYSKRYDYPTATALLALLGYHPDITYQAEAFMILLARLLPLISVEPIHGVEFTIQGTGKTTVALIYEVSANWRYFAEVPSLATLVGDARTGTALIAHVNGVWFDEFDAWVTDSSKRAQMRELVETLLTGMWQGVWKRSKGGIHAVEVVNPVPLWHSGNIYGAEHPRNKLITIIRSITPDKALPYNDRIAVAITATREDLPETIQSHTLARKSGKTVYGKPSVIRGAVDMLQELATNAEDIETKELKARMRVNYVRVHKALQVLLSKSINKIEYDRDLVDKLAKKYVEGVVIA